MRRAAVVRLGLALRAVRPRGAGGGGAGAALVLADIATFRELWDDAAFLCQADDAAGFAAAIDRAGRRSGVAATARRRARERARLVHADLQAQTDGRQAYAASGAAPVMRRSRRLR